MAKFTVPKGTILDFLDAVQCKGPIKIVGGKTKTESLFPNILLEVNDGGVWAAGQDKNFSYRLYHKIHPKSESVTEGAYGFEDGTIPIDSVDELINAIKLLDDGDVTVSCADDVLKVSVGKDFFEIPTKAVVSSMNGWGTPDFLNFDLSGEFPKAFKGEKTIVYNSYMKVADVSALVKIPKAMKFTKHDMIYVKFSDESMCVALGKEMRKGGMEVVGKTTNCVNISTQFRTGIGNILSHVRGNVTLYLGKHPQGYYGFLVCERDAFDQKYYIVRGMDTEEVTKRPPKKKEEKPEAEEKLVEEEK